MTDYYWGIAVGALIGYCLSIITMMIMWSLCVVAKKSDEGREYDGEQDEANRISQN